MPTPEQVEKTRQSIMRLRELLDIMHLRLEHGERGYAKLFDHISDEDKATKPEKELQRLAAYPFIENPKQLADVALEMRFFTRNLEKEFEELFDIIMTEHEFE